MEKQDIETGTVLKTEGDWATVVTNKSKSCRECGKAQAGICGKSGSGMVIKARNAVNAKISDIVLLDLDKKTHMKSYFFAFVLPVVALFIGTYTGYLVSQSTGIKGFDVAGGFIGLIVTIVYSVNRLRKIDKTIQLKITRVLHDAPEIDSFTSPEEMDYISVLGRSNETASSFRHT